MCTRKGLQCGGYSRELKWSYKHEKDPVVYEFAADFFVEMGKTGEDKSESTSPNAGSAPAPGPVPAAAMPTTSVFKVSQTGANDASQDGSSTGNEFDFDYEGQFPASLDLDFDTINDQYDDLFFTMMDASCDASIPNAIPNTIPDPIHEHQHPHPHPHAPLPQPQTQQSPPAADPAMSILSSSSDMGDTIPIAASTTPTASTSGEDDHPIEMFTNNSSAPFLLPSSALTSLPDTTLQLITSWFDQVCPAWSAFDSRMNLNRKLASDLWHHSPAVFNSLQSMSASFLSARLPQMRRPALSLMRTATLCVQTEVASLRGQSKLRAVPTGLLFSLCCLGTTVCWLDASCLGIPFLREAKALLARVEAQQDSLIKGPHEREVMSFFRKSLTYWEMLLAVTGPDDLETDWDDESMLQDPFVAKPRMGPNRPRDGEEAKSVDDQPHPWTGVSTKISYLFARSIKLCRTFRGRVSRGAETTAGYVRDIQAAQKLEEQLLELDFMAVVGPAAATVDRRSSETGDRRTPWLHLARVAEAYKLSSLLQLYQTFPDLVSLRLPMNAILSGDGQVPWEKWITPLNLKLIEILRHIPPDSGSRVIQPLLYICASTGLRFNLMDSSILLAPQQQQQQQQQQHVPPVPPSAATGAGSGRSSGSSSSSADLLDYIGQIDGTEAPDLGPVSVSRMALDICNARNFVMTRLNILEGSLQPKPIIVAKDLVKAIWASYDGEVPGCTSVHWLDVMESEDLRSLFG